MCDLINKCGVKIHDITIYSITTVTSILTFSFFWSFQQPFPWPLFDKAFTHSFQEDSMGKCYKWRRHKKNRWFADALYYARTVFYCHPPYFYTCYCYAFLSRHILLFLLLNSGLECQKLVLRNFKRKLKYKSDFFTAKIMNL